MIKNCALYLSIFFPVFIFSQKKDFVNKKDDLQPGSTTSISFIIENTDIKTKIYDLQVAAYAYSER